jgi:hypothetical protein
VDAVGGAILNWNLAMINLSHPSSQLRWFLWPLALWAAGLAVHAATETATRLRARDVVQPMTGTHAPFTP